MLKESVVEPAMLGWASPLMLAAMNDGELLFCVDYRTLNAMTVRDTHLLPLIDY